MTALTQSLQEEYKLSIKWNKEHGLSSEGITDKNNTPIEKHNINNANNYRTISDITDDLNQVDVLYNSFKETLRKCKASEWSRNILHILQQRFDDLTEELNHTKLHIKNDISLSENSINNAIDLLNKLDYLVRYAESIHKNINDNNNNNDKDKLKENMKNIYIDINSIVKSLLACEDIQNTGLITVVQGISSNIKSISPAYDILKDSIMKLKKLLENEEYINNRDNSQNQYESLINNKKETTTTTTTKPATGTVKEEENDKMNNIGKLLQEAEYVQEEYNILKQELSSNPSAERIMEIQSSLNQLMRRANNLESVISTIKSTSSSNNNDIELTPLGIEKRLTELSEKYDDLCYRIKNCKNEDDKDKLRYEINNVLKETKSLNERISKMKPEEKESMKNQLQNILISGVKCCKEECSGREERYGFLTDYYKKYLPITSDKMLKEFVDLGMQLCSTEMA